MPTLLPEPTDPLRPVFLLRTSLAEEDFAEEDRGGEDDDIQDDQDEDDDPWLDLPPAPGTSRLGGPFADLPAGLTWPCDRTTPLLFLGQLNLADLPPLDGAHRDLLPRRGVLAVFLASAPPAERDPSFPPQAELGPPSTSPAERDPALRGSGRLCYFPEPARLRRTRAPANAPPALPTLDVAIEPLTGPGALSAGRGSPRHRVLGHPDLPASDPSIDASWTLLLQIDSEEDFSLGDGRVQVLIRETDLRARRFEEAHLVWQRP